jgi:CheY-like chemotaxis protein
VHARLPTDLDEVRRRLAETARDWLPGLFPAAHKSADGKTLRCADLSGRAPRGEGSCVIHLEGRFAGWGFDHATGENAGPIDMVHHSTGLKDARLFAEAARLARIDLPASRGRVPEPRTDHSREITRILEDTQPIAGTVAETYLRSRGLDLPFVLISGEIGEDVAVKAMRKGASDYLLKSNLARLAPALAAIVEESFTPSAEEFAWADRVLAALEASDPGILPTLDGQLIESGYADVARAIAAARAWRRPG